MIGFACNRADRSAFRLLTPRARNYYLSATNLRKPVNGRRDSPATQILAFLNMATARISRTDARRSRIQLWLCLGLIITCFALTLLSSPLVSVGTWNEFDVDMFGWLFFVCGAAMRWWSAFYRSEGPWPELAHIGALFDVPPPDAIGQSPVLHFAGLLPQQPDLSGRFCGCRDRIFFTHDSRRGTKNCATSSVSNTIAIA